MKKRRAGHILCSWRAAALAILYSSGPAISFGQCLETRLYAPLGLAAIDGDYVLVAAKPQAVIYRHSQHEWVEDSVLTCPDSSDQRFGSAVAIRGETAVIGSVYDSSTGGALYLFRRQGDAWLFDQRLAAPYLTSALAMDEGLIVAGAHRYGSSGGAYVFRLEAAGWRQEAVLAPFDGGAGGRFGAAVAVEGNRVVIGRDWDDFSGVGCMPGYCRFGSAYVFAFDGSMWRTEQKLISFSPHTWENLGRSVAISGDRILVGMGLDGWELGSAYAFVREADTWRGIRKFSSTVGGLGFQVAAQGNHALVGAGERAFLFEPGESPAAWQDEPVGQLVFVGVKPLSMAMDARHVVVGTWTGHAHVFGLFEGPDADGDGVNDACEYDCDADGRPDAAEVYAGSGDCDLNGQPDQCDSDCNNDGRADSCDLRYGEHDCNENRIHDACDIAFGTSDDCSGNGQPDECESDCNENGIADSCDIFSEASPDTDRNDIPDECDSWSHCVTDPSLFDFGPHRFDWKAEFLGMLVTNELRVPDDVYDRIVRDLASLYEEYPILKSVTWPQWHTNQVSLGLDLSQSTAGFDEINHFFQSVDVHAVLDSHPHWKLITFCDSLNARVLRAEYEALPEVIYVDPTCWGYDCNGDYVDLHTEGDLYVYEFSNGEGDCLSCCYCRQNWRFTITPTGSIVSLDYSPGPCGCGDHPSTLPNDGDFDGDGVIDCLDPCSADEDGGTVDADWDGVGDLCDGCPETIRGAWVDASGCPAKHPADADRDGDIDLEDFARFRSCWRNPFLPVSTYDCWFRRLDSDEDVDLSDFAIFQNRFSGANSPIPANLSPCEE